MSRIYAAVVAALAFAGGASAQTEDDLKVYEVDRAGSHLYVVTHKAGLLGFLGHEHAILPHQWEAELCLANPVPAGAHGSIVVQTASLVIDSDSARALAGIGDGPGAEDRREIQRKMLGAEYLHADSFPEIRLELRAPQEAEEGRLDALGTLSLHGVTRDISSSLSVQQGDGGALILSGSLRILHTDFGLEPESMGGVVKVANEVDLHLRLVARPAEQDCGAATPRGAAAVPTGNGGGGGAPAPAP